MTSELNGEPLHIRFESATRYYVVRLEVDLFDAWIVTRAWGAKQDQLGQLRHDHCLSYARGIALVEQVRRRRLRRGYEEKD
jgi:hypothetical protein